MPAEAAVLEEPIIGGQAPEAAAPVDPAVSPPPAETPAPPPPKTLADLSDDELASDERIAKLLETHTSRTREEVTRSSEETAARTMHQRAQEWAMHGQFAGALQQAVKTAVEKGEDLNPEQLAPAVNAAFFGFLASTVSQVDGWLGKRIGDYALPESQVAAIRSAEGKWLRENDPNAAMKLLELRVDAAVAAGVAAKLPDVAKEQYAKAEKDFEAKGRLTKAEADAEEEEGKPRPSSARGATPGSGIQLNTLADYAKGFTANPQTVTGAQYMDAQSRAKAGTLPYS